MGNCICKNKENEVVPSLPYEGKKISAKVYDVYDGDTVKYEFDCGGLRLRWKLRVEGIDTPEIRSVSELEKETALLIRDYLRNKLNEKNIKIRHVKWDKYGGRVVGELFMPNGKSLADHLLYNRLAKPYDGGKKIGWKIEELMVAKKNCEELVNKNDQHKT